MAVTKLQPGYYWYWEYTDQPQPPEIVRLGPDDLYGYIEGDDDEVTEAEYVGSDVPRELSEMHGRFQAIEPPKEPPPFVCVLLDVDGNVVARWLNPVLVSRLYKSRDVDVQAMIHTDPNFEPTKAIKPREFEYTGPNNGQHIFKERV